MWRVTLRYYAIVSVHILTQYAWSYSCFMCVCVCVCKTVDYNYCMVFGQKLNILIPAKRISSERASQGEHNDTNCNFIAPSNKEY